MKTTLLAFAFMLSVQTNAQTITSTSSAEDALQFIENVTKSNLGKGEYPLVDIEFKGAEIVASRDFGTSLHTESWTTINWAKFTGMHSTAQNDKDRVFVEFDFDSKILTKSTLTRKGTDYLFSLKAEEDDYFSFYIPLSEKDKLPELEVAANRLATIAKANGSTLLAVRSRKVPDEGKPTYKQTAEYIKSYFDNDNKKQHERIRTMWYGRGYLESLSYKILYVEIAGCTLYIGYEVLKTNHFHKTEERSRQSHEIDISQIEDIKLALIGQHDAEIKQQHFVNNLSFKVKYQSTEMMLPFDIIAASAENNGKETQIYKAFNHLRKLCGAPEPVTFE